MPISGYTAKGNEVTILKRELHSHVHSITNNSQDLKFPLRDGWIKKISVSLKKQGNSVDNVGGS